MNWFSIILGKAMIFWIGGICIMGIVGIDYMPMDLVLLAVAGLAFSTFAEMHVEEDEE